MIDSQPLDRWPPDASGLDGLWRDEWNAFAGTEAGAGLLAFVRARLHAGARIYPPEPLRALALTSAARTSVVIVGQDPYHGPGQAEGLAFSVARGTRLPPSLRNIYRELGVARADGSLVDWARRGVLLLNTCLTVEEGSPASHAGRGWERFTDALLAARARAPGPCVYMLWGAHAQSKRPLIEGVGDAKRMCVLASNHPSPLSARRGPTPFLGCGHFEKARDWLAQQGVADPFTWD